MAQFSPLRSRPTSSRRTFEIEGRSVVLNPLHLVSISVDRLGERVASLKDDGDRMIAAIDLLITRAWE